MPPKSPRHNRESRGSIDDLGSAESEDDEFRPMQFRTDSVVSASSILGEIPLSMLKYASSGDDGDIESFKEDCWRMISTAYMGGGIAELANDLSDASGEDENRIMVGVRTRPINDREMRLGTRGCVEHLSDNRNIIIRKYNWKDEPYDMTFAFDYAFGEDSTQEQVWN